MNRDRGDGIVNIFGIVHQGPILWLRRVLVTSEKDSRGLRSARSPCKSCCDCGVMQEWLDAHGCCGCCSGCCGEHPPKRHCGAFGDGGGGGGTEDKGSTGWGEAILR